MRDPRAILITGASSGLGAALARAYAWPGIALALTGRDRTRLEATAAACRSQGAEILAETVDARDRAEMERFVAAAEVLAPLELVIANAGVSAGTGFAGERAEQVREIFAANVEGVFNTVLPALPLLR